MDAEYNQHPSLYVFPYLHRRAFHANAAHVVWVHQSEPSASAQSGVLWVFKGAAVKERKDSIREMTGRFRGFSFSSTCGLSSASSLLTGVKDASMCEALSDTALNPVKRIRSNRKRALLRAHIHKMFWQTFRQKPFFTQVWTGQIKPNQ